jgi:FkbM family methyltransferase
MNANSARFYLWVNKLIWPLFYLRHQTKPTVMVETRDGARFQVRVNTSDRFIVWEIWKARVYDDARLPIGVGDVVIDIGAHIGAFAVRAARLAHRGQVYAYEASSNNYALLTKNRQLNGLENLHVTNRAVSNRHGMLPFYTVAGNGALGSLVQTMNDSREQVQAMPFTDIIAEHGIERVDLLKVDVEGAEYDILLNGPDDMLAKVQRVVLEYHEFRGEERSHRDLVQLLRAHGFHVVVERGLASLMDWFGAWFGGNIVKTGIIKAWRE